MSKNLICNWSGFKIFYSAKWGRVIGLTYKILECTLGLDKSIEMQINGFQAEQTYLIKPNKD